MSNGSFLSKYRFTIILLIIMIIITVFVLLQGQGPAENVPHLNASMIIIMVIVGLAAGLLGGWIGTGGCSVMLPVLHFCLGFPASRAVGTTLFAVIFTAISGGYGHFKQKNLDNRAAMWMGIAGIIGVIIGSWFFTFLYSKSQLLGFIIGIVFLWPALRMIMEAAIGMAAVNSLIDLDENRCIELNAAELILEKGRVKNATIVGYSASLSQIFFDHGIDAVSGTRVVDPDLALKCVSQSANYRQIKGIKKFTMKKNS